MATAITTEDDPTPLVLILANTLRRSVEINPGRVAKMKGVATICSKRDPQAVTIRFNRGAVHLVHGRRDDAQITITIDFTTDGLPNSPKPKVTGALGHPRFALALAKALEPPLPDWREAAESFWLHCADLANMPSGILIVETVSAGEHVIGDPSTNGYELHGSADRLACIFTGGAFALEELISGRIRARGSLAAGVAMTNAGLALGLGKSAVTTTGTERP